MWACLLHFEQWAIHVAPDSQCSPKALGYLFHPCWHWQFSQPGWTPAFWSVWPFFCCVVSPSPLCPTTQCFRCFHGPQQLLFISPRRNPNHAPVLQPLWPAHPWVNHHGFTMNKPTYTENKLFLWKLNLVAVNLHGGHHTCVPYLCGFASIISNTHTNIRCLHIFYLGRL